MTFRVLVTGGKGLVGKALAARLLAQGFAVRVSTRQKHTTTDLHSECALTTDLSATTDWFPALQAIDTVVHCAARVHVMHDTEGDPLAAFRVVNVDGTLNLARQAAAGGGKTFCVCELSQGQRRVDAPGAAVHGRRCACATGCLWCF